MADVGSQASRLFMDLAEEALADPVDLAVRAMRALVDRGLPQDLIDVHAACQYYSVIELEQLGEFDLCELRDRLESVVWVSDEEFAAYGLSPEDIAELRRWALEWESDLGLRILEDYDDPADADD